jgi:hypothetical protein
VRWSGRRQQRAAGALKIPPGRCRFLGRSRSGHSCRGRAGRNAQAPASAWGRSLVRWNGPARAALHPRSEARCAAPWAASGGKASYIGIWRRGNKWTELNRRHRQCPAHHHREAARHVAACQNGIWGSHPAESHQPAHLASWCRPGAGADVWARTPHARCRRRAPRARRAHHLEEQLQSERLLLGRWTASRELLRRSPEFARPLGVGLCSDWWSPSLQRAGQPP